MHKRQCLFDDWSSNKAGFLLKNSYLTKAKHNIQKWVALNCSFCSKLSQWSKYEEVFLFSTKYLEIVHCNLILRMLLEFFERNPNFILRQGHDGDHRNDVLIRNKFDPKRSQQVSQKNHRFGDGKTVARALPLPGKAKWFKAVRWNLGSILFAKSLRIEPKMLYNCYEY